MYDNKEYLLEELGRLELVIRDLRASNSGMMEFIINKSAEDDAALSNMSDRLRHYGNQVQVLVTPPKAIVLQCTGCGDTHEVGHKDCLCEHCE